MTRILDDRVEKLAELLDPPPPQAVDAAGARLRESFELYVARVEDWLRTRRRDLSGFNDTLVLPLTLEVVESPRAFLLSVVAAFETHLRELGAA